MSTKRGFVLKGWDKYAERVRDAGIKVQELADAEAQAAATNIANAARNRAPMFDGKLRASIHTGGKDGKYSIYASASYAAYVEFGTRSRVQIPDGLADYAKQFKGKGGGTLDDLFLAIMEWVRKKGLAGTYSIKTRKRVGGGGKMGRKSEDYDVAFPIVMSILKKGIHAQPYLFPSVEEEKPKFFERIKAILGDL